jgi:hypothetical protein
MPLSDAVMSYIGLYYVSVPKARQDKFTCTAFYSVTNNAWLMVSKDQVKSSLNRQQALLCLLEKMG